MAKSKIAKEMIQTKRRARPKREVGKLFEDLVTLQARLRAPGGCPWDREQNHETLRPYLIEEAYEVLDALDSGDPAHIAEELGDLLLQVVFHAQLGAEVGSFDIAGVIEHIHTKMVRRHPHVFGQAEAETAAQVLKKWEELKAEERAAKRTEGESPGPAGKFGPGGKALPEGNPGTLTESVLDGVPRGLPALLEAHQLTRRAANVGFDWSDVGGILEKLEEEAGELRRVLQKPPEVADRAEGAAKRSPNRREIEDEVGDLLFVCVNLARFLGLDAEIALKKANLKFAQRFRQMERTAAQRGRKLSELPADELENLWREAKRTGL